jgi:ribosomal protein S18 acetylase RimI-like enzyme
MSVRRVRADDADLMRELRLRALRDAPLAFGSNYERELAFDRAVWEERVRANADGRESVGFVLEPAGGMAVGRIHDDEADVAQLYGMWVAPEARRGGAGRALVDAVIAWAIDRGARRLITQVTEGNDAALRLYERAGFADTGEREPLGHSGAMTIVLERPLP